MLLVLEFLGVGLPTLAHLGGLYQQLIVRRQEFMQRRVKQPDNGRPPAHGLQDAVEVALLYLLKLGQRAVVVLDGLGTLRGLFGLAQGLLSLRSLVAARREFVERLPGIVPRPVQPGAFGRR